MKSHGSDIAAGLEGALVLADGSKFRGVAFGARRTISDPICGEAVFNTSLLGYQEILSDPSYAGQIMCFTAPHIGNVGCNNEDIESRRVFVEGVVVRQLSAVVSNFRAQHTFEGYLAQHKIMGLSGVDTRALVMHLRTQGAQMAVLACGENLDIDSMIDKARSLGTMVGKDYVREVSCTKPYVWDEPPWSLSGVPTRSASSNDAPHIVAVDCGIKYNILRLLVGTGFRVTVVPSTYCSADILALRPDGVFLSNGPGDPAALPYLVQAVSGIVGKVPVFGICLGHQILGQVFGARTFKLKFGHRGGNHPVKDLSTGRVEITVQNHGFAVDPAGLAADVTVSHLNLNDGTVEGLDAPSRRAFCVQYHPEGSPGPHDSQYLFRRFYNLVTR